MGYYNGLVYSAGIKSGLFKTTLEPVGKENGFYLNHILEYALQSDVNNLGRSKLEKTFAPIHCSVK